MDLPKYVLDASALIAFLTGEEGCIKVGSLISQAKQDKIVMYLAAVNLLEVFYDYLKRDDNQEEATEFLNVLYNLPVVIANKIDREWLEQAAELKATFKMSLADSIGLSLAQQQSAFFVTADHHEFDIVESNNEATFCWIR